MTAWLHKVKEEKTVEAIIASAMTELYNQIEFAASPDGILCTWFYDDVPMAYGQGENVLAAARDMLNEACTPGDL